MTFHFFLTQVGISRNIRLGLQDLSTGIDYDFYIPLKIHPEDWDAIRQRPRNIYIKKFKKLNAILDRIKVVVNEYVTKKKADGRSVSHKSIFRQINKLCIDQQPEVAEGSLLRAMQQYIEQKSELICNSTYKRYKVFYNIIQRFEGFIHKSLQVEYINADFVKEFMIFGREELYSESTINRTIHFVRTILNFVERKGIRTHLRELEIKTERTKQEIVTLNEEEIIQIQDTEVPAELESAKDWLLISCFTGQRFSDFIHFSHQQLIEIKGKHCMQFTQQKTKKNIVLPLHPVVMQILKKNNDHFPRPLSMQSYNQNIRKVARLAGINTMLNTKKRMGYRVKNIYAEKWVLLSSHIGRRSFATNFYGKIPTPLLLEATGHSTEKMFLHYINHYSQNRIISLSNYFEDIYNREAAFV